MLETIEAIIEFARHEMEVERINAIAYIQNKSCIKLLERLVVC
jgi:RimJ/RimL family protein N-acetyltransferase